jgi:aspartate aminotransferase-like enzyme
LRRLLMIPGPTNVPDRILKAMAKPMINHRGSEFHDLQERIVDGLKYAFQTKADVYALTCSGTGGVEAAIFNVVDEGDEVIVPVGGVFAERMAEEVKSVGGRVVEVPLRWGSAVKASQVEEALESHPGAKAVALVYNETSTGATARELRKIGELTHRRGVLLIVDAISILGGDELKVDDWHIDICIAGSQKCLACPPGLALISVSPRAWKVMEERRARRSFYFDLLACRRFHEERRETPFTPALPLYFALDEALKMLREEGLERRIERHRRCASALYEAFESMKLSLLADPEARSNTVIAAEYPPGVDDAKFRAAMRDEFGVEVAGGMGRLKGRIFRVGSMGVVSGEDVLATVEATAKSLAKQGYKASVEEALEAARRALKLGV